VPDGCHKTAVAISETNRVGSAALPGRTEPQPPCRIFAEFSATSSRIYPRKTTTEPFHNIAFGLTSGLHMDISARIRSTVTSTSSPTHSPTLNAFTGEIDPRHVYGMSNFDILWWDGLVNGTHKSVLGTSIASLLMPGAPLVSYYFPSC